MLISMVIVTTITETRAELRKNVRYIRDVNSSV